MRAAAFEFRFRFLILCLIFAAGFCCYFFDPVNATRAFMASVEPGLSIETASRIGFGADAVLVTWAALLRTWATAYLAGGVVHDSRLHTERVVSCGPYRYVRNPLYLANAVMAVGFAGLASRLGWFIVTAGVLLFQYRLILREESLLQSEQGEVFRNYASAVPRFIPALRPRVPECGVRPAWSQAFRAEAMFFGLAASLFFFAATFSRMWTAAIQLASILTYLISVRAGRQE